MERTLEHKVRLENRWVHGTRPFETVSALSRCVLSRHFLLKGLVIFYWGALPRLLGALMCSLPNMSAAILGGSVQAIFTCGTDGIWQGEIQCPEHTIPNNRGMDYPFGTALVHLCTRA